MAGTAKIMRGMLDGEKMMMGKSRTVITHINKS
jgi:hypothetical protein